MADLIERNAAIEAYCADCCSMFGTTICENDGMCRDIDVLKKVPAVNRWIPCSEKRPDLWGEYLTYNAENGAMYVLSFSPADNTFGIYDGNVTHWMPLPEPPESEVQHD